jgi:hypothetical protein
MKAVNLVVNPGLYERLILCTFKSRRPMVDMNLI